MNFTSFGNHFASMHQFSAAGKPGTGQPNASAILVPSTTSSSHYHHSSIDNHVNYPNNNHIVSTTIMPSQHHHQDIRHLMNQNNLSHPPATSQSNWVDLGLHRSSNELIKSPLNIPTYTIQASTANTAHAIQWPLRTVMTQNVSTMTDLEKPENLCKNGSKDQGFSDDSDDSSKSSINDNTYIFGRDNCSKIHLKHQGNVMAEYLARLQPSSMPLSIQQFLQQHNIKTTNDNGSSPKKRNLDSSKLKSSDIRISTALDGSTLFCCPECHMAYARRDLLDQHMTGK